MNEYFKTEIKPLNDDLGRKLGLRINVKYRAREYEVPVMVTVTSPQGSRVTMLSDHLKNVRALGLKI